MKGKAAYQPRDNGDFWEGEEEENGMRVGGGALAIFVNRNVAKVNICVHQLVS